MAQPRPSKPTEPPVEPVRLGRPPVYADIETLPSHLRGEIVGGELYVLPRPRPRHAKVATSLAGRLDDPFQQKRGGPGGWWILIEPELHLEARDRPIDPDLAGWRRDRMPELPEEAAIVLRPDWTCEVLSPSTEDYDRGPKMETYARAGVPWAWLIDPDARVLEVYSNDAGSWRSAGRWSGNALVKAAPFDALEFELGLLWA
jgi:Uma2 family endonuclease